MTPTNSSRFVTCAYASHSSAIVWGLVTEEAHAPGIQVCCNAPGEYVVPTAGCTAHLLCSHIGEHCDSLRCLTGHLDAMPRVRRLPELAPQLRSPKPWQRLRMRVPALARQQALECTVSLCPGTVRRARRVAICALWNAERSNDTDGGGRRMLRRREASRRPCGAWQDAWRRSSCCGMVMTQAHPTRTGAQRGAILRSMHSCTSLLGNM